MTECERFRPLYECYVLNAVEDEERAAIQAHLSQGCPECRREVVRALLLAAQLAYLCSDADPPAALTWRVLTMLMERGPN